MDKVINRKELTDEWFYSEPGWFARLLHIYVRGDAITLLPIWLFILVTGILSWKFMLLEIGLLVFLRGFGEMIYWLLQQFGKQSYRPETEHKKLGNNAVYILYQLSGLRNAFLGLVLVFFVLLYLY